MRRAVLAGSFDPITQGHMDVLRRGLALFDEVVVAIGNNPRKRYLLDLESRVEIVRACTQDMPQVRVDSFDGLLVEYCRKVGASAILRGLRAVSDFEFEFQIGLANKNMAPEVETVFLMTASENIFVSSSLIKEIALNGGDVQAYVPEAVLGPLKSALEDRA
ncbi:MAG: pantetheine-phosphate adenylyltransferase [Myxococcota bacterium]|nr:pantetheine-phosphate adenylyltransferase [Myxococcota bacterium]